MMKTPDPKSEIRFPEARKKAEIRRWRHAQADGEQGAPRIAQGEGMFRASAFALLSAFGLRPSDFGLSLSLSMVIGACVLGQASEPMRIENQFGMKMEAGGRSFREAASNQVVHLNQEMSCAAAKWDGDSWDEIDLGTGSAEAGLGIGLLAMSGLGVFFVWPGRARKE